MKRTVLSLALFSAFGSLPAVSVAQSAPAASPLTANIALTSDYRFRGISQTEKRFAVQGGIDWTGPGGLYLGNWNSTVSDDFYANGRGLEMDFYGGYKFEIAKDVTLDLGAIYYYYPGAYYTPTGKPKYNNFEVYAGVSTGPFSAKVYYALSNLFGINDATTISAPNGDSKGSYYIDLGYSAEIMPKLTLGAHVGYQSVKNYSATYSYSDYKLGVTYDLAGWMLGANVYGTNAANKVAYQLNGKKLGETGLVLSVARTF